MKQNRINIGRREFMKAGSLVVVSAAIASNNSNAAAPPVVRLDEKDPLAQSLGYKHDATKVDKVKFPKYQAGQACANCQLYTGKAADQWGPCPIFSGKEVSAKGWCSSYVKKA